MINREQQNRAYCSIATLSHSFKAKALCASIRRMDPASLIYILFTDTNSPPAIEGAVSLTLQDIHMQEPATSLIAKYQDDKLRWSLKPVLLLYLLNHCKYSSLIYFDNDIYLCADPEIIWNELGGHSVLLTPHHYPADPSMQQNWLEANFRVGLYNAGFLAVNAQATGALTWWAHCCMYRMEKNYWRGLFDDQKYLDLLPVKFPDMKVSFHRGMNLAGWNLKGLSLSRKGENYFLNDSDAVVFIHFNVYTFEVFSGNQSSLIHELLDDYVSLLKRYKPTYQIEKRTRLSLWAEQGKLWVWKMLNRFNH